MPYRFVNPAPVFFNIPGTQRLSGGSWEFCEIGTGNQKDTFADIAMTVPNPNPVPLDSSGRLGVNVWLDGEYTAILRDSQGAVQATRDITSGFEAGQTIPPLTVGFLTNDLSNLIWRDIENLLLPDPTGSTNQIPVSNGVGGYALQDLPEPPEPPDPDILVGDGSFRAGVSSDTTKYLRQYGRDEAPASLGVLTQKAVVYDTPFVGDLPIVQITNCGGQTASGYFPKWMVISESLNGFTAIFNGDEAGAPGSGNFLAPVPFAWSAEGTVEVP